MSDKGEQTCPICAEQMDLTDQLLKPCECGYEVCLWCWNHIMEMAEKDGREGRCPLCRTSYDKEKIMRVAASCKTLVMTEGNQKQRKQKKAPRGPKAKKNLTDVRVLQRNLAYIIGLPLNVAKEELLKRREYFGQYGKVLKVSISPTSTGDIQHATNNSCCVYITYGSEFEAARCIQSVHSYVLDGNSLRACFGTTKYCHAWLKNVPCTNADCMYLHDFGSQEDSFSKDEVITAFERSKDLQILGVMNNLHQRPGKGLPPPADEYRKLKLLSAAKPVAKHFSNIAGDEVNGSCTDEGSRRTTPTRTSWVMQVPPSLPLGTDAEIPSYQKPETSNDLDFRSSEGVSTEIFNHNVRSITSEESCEVSANSMDRSVLTKQNSEGIAQVAVLNKPTEALVDRAPVGMTSRQCLSPDKGVACDVKEPSMDFVSCRNLNCPSPNPKSLCDKNGSNFAQMDSTFDPSSVFPKMGLGKYMEGSENNKPSIDCNLSSDIGESGIISNILTMNLDAPEGLTELHSLVNLLGETDKECSLLRVPSSRKLHEKKQSRFSFAQQEDSCDNMWNQPKDYSCLSGLHKDPSLYVECSNPLSRSVMSSKASATEIPSSIPPGFTVPRRASPPGFTSYGRSRKGDLAFDSSVNYLLQPSAMPTSNSGINSDADLFNPTVMGINNGISDSGRRANLSQYRSSLPDVRANMLRQQSTLMQQNLGFHDHFRYTCSSLNDAHRLSAQHPNQFQPNSSTFVQSTPHQFSDLHVSNNDWVQWNGIKSASDLGISELLRNDRLGFSKFVPCYEETKPRSSYFTNLNSKEFEM